MQTKAYTAELNPYDRLSVDTRRLLYIAVNEHLCQLEKHRQAVEAMRANPVDKAIVYDSIEQEKRKCIIQSNLINLSITNQGRNPYK